MRTPVLAFGITLLACGEHGPPAAHPASTWLHVRTVDTGSGALLPAKLSLWRDGAPVHLAREFDPPACTGTGSSLVEMATGALATWNGIALWRGEATLPIDEVVVERPPACDSRGARVALPYGRYRIVASRGPEYEMAEAWVTLAAGRGTIELALPLARAVDTRGYLSADLHIHTDASGDSTISAENRVKTEVAVGVEVLVSSDHDRHTDLGTSLAHLWPDPARPPPAFAVVGDEVTTTAGHFNLMPVAMRPGAPGGGAVDPHALSAWPAKFLPALHALPMHPLVQVNHPRLGYAAYFDSWACGTDGWRDTTIAPPCPLDFDSVEVMSGTLACGRFIRRQIDDWYALLRFGHVAAGVGSSDTHHESGILAGFPRSFVRIEDGAATALAPSESPSLLLDADSDRHAFSTAAFIAALRARRVVASTGPFLTLTVDRVYREGAFMTTATGRVAVNARVQFPTWMAVDRMRLLVDGIAVKTWTLDGGSSTFAIEDEPVSLAGDAFITVEADGRRALPDWLVGDYVKTALGEDGTRFCPNEDGSFGMIPFAVTNPVLVDVDGDGVWKASARALAARQARVAPTGEVPTKLVPDGCISRGRFAGR